MRLGIFGGTFDPIHYGHLLVAEQCREQCRLDQVWFLPAGVPPHKLERTIVAGKARAEMIEMAIAGHERLRVDRRELDRADPCYTVDTLAALYAEDPSRELFFLLGADSLLDFPTWREPRRIVELARLAVVNRGSNSLPDRGVVQADVGRPSQVVRPGPPATSIEDDLRRSSYKEAPLPDLEPLRQILGDEFESRIEFVTIPGVDISSSDLRRRVREGKSIRYMTPRAVECYIETHKLYAP
jgi:nicotinate-nucleotide adenylyltransferase